MAGAAQSVVPPKDPSFVVTRESILLDGEVVADVTHGLEQESGLIDALYPRLLNRRESVVQKDPASGTGAQWVTAEPGALGTAVLSAVISAARAGYHDVHFKTSTGWVLGRYESLSSERALHDRALVRVGTKEIFLDWQTARPCAAAPPASHFLLSELASKLDTVCAHAGGTCIDDSLLSFAPDEDFTSTLRAFEVIAQHGTPVFTFSMTARRDTEAPFPPPASRKCGEPLDRQKLAGGLAPEVIHRVVRASFGTVRACYGDGLRRNRNLAGRVTVKFDIDLEGKVVTTEILRRQKGPGSDANVPEMPDDAVAECVAKAFGRFSFPKPEGRSVTVVYPIVFSPGD